MANEQELIQTDILSYLKRQEGKELLRFLTCGSVDDGKSTLIGRLLHDTKLIYEDQLAAIKKESARKGSAGGEIDLSLLVDGLAAEREQGITIDVAYRYFSTEKRKFIIADTPGHEQYTRNMATGASTCDLAVILIDARQGVLPQTRRHSFICALLGIKHLVVAVNKMDLVSFSEEVFEKIKTSYTEFADRLGVSDMHFIPISALKGDNVVEPSDNMPWYKSGPLLNYLETVHIGSDRNFVDLRFPVQYVIRPDLTFRGFAGTMASGILRKGDEVVALPGGQRSRIKQISTFDGDLAEAYPPLSVTVTLEDEIDVSRGGMLARPDNTPSIANEFEAMLVWMTEEPLSPGTKYLFKQTTNLVGGTVSDIRYKVDVNTIESEKVSRLKMNEVCRCRVRLERSIPFDSYRQNRTTGSFIMIDRLTNNTVGAGMIIDRKTAGDRKLGLWEKEQVEEIRAERVEGRVSAEEREKRFGHQPKTILLTGLPCVGKTAIAYALERRLFETGNAVTVLDGTEMRQGISKDLGFTSAERSENLRRGSEVARFMNNAGLICICAFVAPDADIREKARKLIGGERFIEVYLTAREEVRRKRDVAGAYRKADSGELPEFPGVSAGYDVPERPDLILETDKMSVEECVDRIMRLLTV